MASICTIWSPASGPAVALLHGFGGSTFSYRWTVPALAKRYHTIAIDLKGFGYSDRGPRGDYSHPEQARLIAGLLDQLGVTKAVLVGHSMGGSVALRLAARSPDRVEGLALINSEAATPSCGCRARPIRSCGR